MCKAREEEENEAKRETQNGKNLKLFPLLVIRSLSSCCSSVAKLLLWLLLWLLLLLLHSIINQNFELCVRRQLVAAFNDAKTLQLQLQLNVEVQQIASSPTLAFSTFWP